MAVTNVLLLAVPLCCLGVILPVLLLIAGMLPRHCFWLSFTPWRYTESVASLLR